MKKNVDKKLDKNQRAIVIYQAGNEIRLDVRLEKDNVWLTQAQIALLFGTQRPAITKHLNNIFNSNELKKKSVCSILEHTAADGKEYKTAHYNLDAIISIGYRVNSKQATQFRIWATRVLKKYLVKGYALNQKRLQETREKFKELQDAISFLRDKSKKELLVGQAGEILNLLFNYSKTLTLLDNYDRKSLRLTRGGKSIFILTYKIAQMIVNKVKEELLFKKEAGALFGQERDNLFEGILKGLEQTFDGKKLYRTLENKAAHLLYFIIKDHPFSDGNKRLAAFMFVYFLDKNNALYRNGGEKKINDNALTALALLVAESAPGEKEQMIALITQLIS